MLNSKEANIAFGNILDHLGAGEDDAKDIAYAIMFADKYYHLLTMENRYDAYRLSPYHFPNPNEPL